MTQLLSKDEVCSILLISKPTLERIIGERRIAVCRIGGRIRFREEDVRDYISKCREPAAVITERQGNRIKKTPACTYVPGMKVV